MKANFLILALYFLASAVMAQRPAQGPMSKQRITPEKLDYHLVWEDEFNGDKLDSTKWKVRGEGGHCLCIKGSSKS